MKGLASPFHWVDRREMRMLQGRLRLQFERALIIDLDGTKGIRCAHLAPKHLEVLAAISTSRTLR